MAKQKKVPQRKCVVTNEMKPKKELIRIVRNKEGEVFVDPTGKKNGRGAYLSNDIAVIEKAEKTDILNRQLDTQIDPVIYDELKEFVKGNSDEK
ncbi:RNase P modulator RnpM [Lentibacillus sp. CBA3610]|uniref:RNase P modulator RnpM n=1 Tax=Lentibacillus sp. CBA3610 TaxID=2518176 RepID=UPI001595D5EC|nr:YlxR family protein [Lentibacillus sp. CBA3610]QKY69061.1 YlxR family protein [Lentibacillus sp. CBA3610]